MLQNSSFNADACLPKIVSLKALLIFQRLLKKFVAEVEKWAEEHRPKTRQEKFLEQFPKAKLFTDGVLDLCPEDLEGTCQYKANTQDTGYHCDKCRKKYWLKEVDDG